MHSHELRENQRIYFSLTNILAKHVNDKNFLRVVPATEELSAKQKQFMDEEGFDEGRVSVLSAIAEIDTDRTLREIRGEEFPNDQAA